MEAGAPGQCSGTERDCAGNVPRVCNNGRWDSLAACAAPKSACDDGHCIEPNCVGIPLACGNNQSCCESALVPGAVVPMGRSENASAADYFASGDADEIPEHSATPLGYRLDLFEVTVARFRRFFDEYPASAPAAGDGAHPGIPNSGWDSAWDSELEEERFLGTVLSCTNRHTWSPDVIEADAYKPINCVNWYLAFAFCAWDGGFLPTEADWEAAAAAGAQNRLYPWPNGTTPDNTLAVFDCNYDGMFPCDWADIPPVGSVPQGAGRWKHLDLGGSMEEWTLDAFASDWYSTGGQNCINCANLTGTQRTTRGGSWQSAPEELRAAARRARDPGEYHEAVGIRCARPSP